MSKIKYYICLFLALNTSYAQVNLCYFSLNNEKEVQVMQSFAKELNLYSEEKINVKEFQELGSNPVTSFKNMVKSNYRCDGLVISGHHTGSFGGKRANGPLSVELLEKLSCNPDYANWFNQISAVWLQGCRTLGVTINAEEYEDYEEGADFHTRRLENLLEEDALEQSLLQINMEFSDVLDQDNPLQTRYLRTFINATLFGWTKTAPGVNAQSEKSIPYHISHISRILNPSKEAFFQNPSTKMKPVTAKRYSDILIASLTRTRPGNYVLKNRIDEQALIDGWLEHGQAIGDFPFSFTNPDLMAYKSISSGKTALSKAKQLSCNLQQASSKNEEQLLAALRDILQTKEMIYYNLNLIAKLMYSFEEKNKLELLSKMREMLKESSNFTEVIYQKLTNKEIGLMRFLEYYQIYTIVVGKRNLSIEKIIRSKAFAILTSGDSTTNRNIFDIN